jgi:hypothetical protein
MGRGFRGFNTSIDLAKENWVRSAQTMLCSFRSHRIDVANRADGAAPWQSLRSGHWSSFPLKIEKMNGDCSPDIGRIFGEPAMRRLRRCGSRPLLLGVPREFLGDIDPEGLRGRDVLLARGCLAAPEAPTVKTGGPVQPATATRFTWLRRCAGPLR